MSEAPRSRVGNIIANRFRLDRWLGGSGDSAVYEAQDVVTHRRLALKLLDASAPDRARRRMAREALAIARLTHRHIVRVESVGVEADGSVFLVQDLLEGPTLAEILATRGFLSIQEALEIFEPLLDALAHAHDHGIVHRDVKPSNIVLAGSDADGTIPTLIDFGIADKLDRSDERRDTADAILGTPPYMAPEQAFEPAQVDARADVWGVAMTLHEAIAGTLPINATSFAGFLGEVRELDSKTERILPSAPAAVRRAIMRALRVSRDARTPSVRQLASELNEALAETQASAKRATIAPPRPTTSTGSGDEDASRHTSVLKLALVVSADDIDPLFAQDQLRRSLGRPASVVRMRNYAELVNALATGEADLAWLPPVACARALGLGAARLIATIDRARGSGYRCALLGRSEVVRAYSDVPGRRAVWVDAWSAAGYLVPRAMLRHNGVDPERALAAQMFVGSYSGVIDALRARTADIGATFCPLEAAAPALVELPRDDASVSVIDVSDPIPPDAWCASSRLQSPLVDELRRLVLDATEGGAIAAAFGAAAFRPPDPAAYEMLSAALDDSP